MQDMPALCKYYHQSGYMEGLIEGIHLLGMHITDAEFIELVTPYLLKHSTSYHSANTDISCEIDKWLDYYKALS